MGHVDEELNQDDSPDLHEAEPVTAEEQQGHQDDQGQAAHAEEIDNRGENGGGAGSHGVRRWGCHGLKESPAGVLGNRFLSGPRGRPDLMLYSLLNLTKSKDTPNDREGHAPSRVVS